MYLILWLLYPGANLNVLPRHAIARLQLQALVVCQSRCNNHGNTHRPRYLYVYVLYHKLYKISLPIFCQSKIDNTNVHTRLRCQLPRL
jgi:hypothetical protein